MRFLVVIFLLVFTAFGQVVYTATTVNLVDGVTPINAAQLIGVVPSSTNPLFYAHITIIGNTNSLPQVQFLTERLGGGWNSATLSGSNTDMRVTGNLIGTFVGDGAGLANLNLGTNSYTITTASNPTNAYSTATVYTAPNQRSSLVGAAVLNPATTGNANITLYYTNNSVGYVLPMQAGSGITSASVLPFNVRLGTNATFSFISTMGTGASGYLTNVVLWKE